QDTSTGNENQYASTNESMISPNPIIVNNSGIEGVFDIQRVIVKMNDPDVLRQEVRSASSEAQKISGHCIISTGFAWVRLAFSCEKNVLEKQLNVCDVIDRTVLNQELDNDRHAPPSQNQPAESAEPGMDSSLNPASPAPGDATEKNLQPDEVAEDAKSKQN